MDRNKFYNEKNRDFDKQKADELSFEFGDPEFNEIPDGVAPDQDDAPDSFISQLKLIGDLLNLENYADKVMEHIKKLSPDEAAKLMDEIILAEASDERIQRVVQAGEVIRKMKEAMYDDQSETVCPPPGPDFPDPKCEDYTGPIMIDPGIFAALSDAHYEAMRAVEVLCGLIWELGAGDAAIISARLEEIIDDSGEDSDAALVAYQALNNDDDNEEG